jgi:uncharacterized protein (DUF1778 family)
MAKQKPTEKKSDLSPDQTDEKEVNVKVFPAERDLINRVAGARGEKVARLFQSKEMRTFLTHLLAAAAKTAEERLEEQG